MTKKGIPKKDGSGKGMRANRGRSGCDITSSRGRGKGWFGQSGRHALASRGIKTAIDFLEENDLRGDSDILDRREFKTDGANGITIPVKDGKNTMYINNIESILKVKSENLNGDEEKHYVLQLIEGDALMKENLRSHDDFDSYIIFNPERNMLTITNSRIDFSEAGTKRLQNTLEKMLDDSIDEDEVWDIVYDLEEKYDMERVL